MNWLKKRWYFNRRNRSDIISGYLFVSPWLIGLIVFTIVPIIQSFYYSLNVATIQADTLDLDYIGFENFHRLLFVDARFPTLIALYVVEMVINIPIAIVFSLLIALLINQPIRGQGGWRVIFFLPVIIVSGPIIQELQAQGATTLPILNDPTIRQVLTDYLPEALSNAVISLLDNIIVILWYTGIPILIFLAGLQKIDRSIYEAASIDGASPWESFWKITLPAMKPFMTVNIIYLLVVLSYDANLKGSEIIDYIYEQSFSSIQGFGFGYGSAIAWLFFVVIVLLILLFVGILNLQRNR